MENVENLQSEGVIETVEITIAGMGCDNCVKKLERALRGRDGIKEVRIDGIGGHATVTFDRARVNVPEIQEVIAKSGYRAGAAA